MGRNDLLGRAAVRLAEEYSVPDPRALKPAELCRMLNSTPLGEVLGVRQLHRHRSRAGYRIGDDKTIDLFRYGAWLFDLKHAPPPVPAQAAPDAGSAADYDTIKERARERSSQASRSGRDIAPLPPVKDPERRERCRKDLLLFAENYFSELFYLGWSDDQRKVIVKIEQAVLEGGLCAFAMPRGSGKTTICEVASIWAVVYGHLDFVVPIGATADKAKQILESIKSHLETNELLAEDFPEVCYPIVCLEGIANRCSGQLHLGKRTLISWTKSQIILPTIAGSQASGAVIRTVGLLGSIRGMKHTKADGTAIRPKLVLIDDPQTDSSAQSKSQCDKRVRILTGAILGLAGPGKKISGVMPCTVIAPEDMADEILDRKKYPQWQGERTKMMDSLPTNLKLWDEYADIRKRCLRDECGLEEANKFYLKHRKAMDVGARVAWPDRFESDEISGIQHAMNKRIDLGEQQFDAEYQNSPHKTSGEEEESIDIDLICAKLTRLKPSVVPVEMTHVVGMIDVQKKMLFYVLAAFNEQFSGALLDYGTYPDQNRHDFTLHNAKISLAGAFPKMGMEAYLYAGLQELVGRLCATEYRMASDGGILRLERLLIDANWGQSTDTVYKFCRQSAHSALLLPSHGRGIGASSVPLNNYDKKPGEKRGDNWIIGPSKAHRGVRHISYDTNYWKSFVLSRLMTAQGDPGSFELFGEKPEQHSLFARHLLSEYGVKTHGRGRTVTEWKLRPDRPDNHWWDCLVGCHLAAAVEGCDLFGGLKPQANKPKKKWSEIAREKREARR